jgi:hypothetical protein
MSRNDLSELDLKRVFVTATPENCVMLYNIECPDVMKLEIPANYTGYNKIEHQELDDDMQINNLIHDEVRRIKKE